MSNEITVHNIADTIRTKVKDYILESIPKEQFDGLIKKQWEDFFTDKSDSWNSKPSEFEILVKSAIKAELEVKINESVRQELEKLKPQWSTTGEKVVSQVIEQYASSFISGLAKDAAEHMIRNMQNQRGIY